MKTEHHARELAHFIIDRHWDNARDLGAVLLKKLRAAEKRGAKRALREHKCPHSVMHQRIGS